MEERWVEYAKWVGWVAMSAARVEWVVAEAVMMLVGTARVEPLVHGAGWEACRNGLNAVVQDRISEAVDRDDRDDRELIIPALNKLLGTVKETNPLMQDRSHVVHALWGSDTDPEFSTLQFRRWGKHRGGSWSPEKLESLAERLRDAALAIYQQQLEVGFLLGLL